ncbi:MAG: FAD-dependent thymidylate synthase [Acidobacteriota bacterium]
MRLASPPPDVRLVNAFERPYDNAVAAARTCYAAKGIVLPEQVAGEDVSDPAERAQVRARRDEIAESIYRAGHHTVFQHAHFQFAIDRISRHALWAFFHAHPFYNSEQVSQRYVRVRPGSVLVPRLDGAAQPLYEQTVEHQQRAYRELTELLVPVAGEIFFRIFPARARQPERWKREIRRKAQEAARYVLPVATWARLYHTISGITLLRYHRACRQPDVPWEVAEIVSRMAAAVRNLDPDFGRLLEEPLPLEDSPDARALAGVGGAWNAARARAFREEFDAGLAGRVSRLVGWAPDAEALTAQAVREVLGAPRHTLSDDEAIAMLADPARNTLLGEALNLTTLSPLSRAMHHAHYTFRKKLSHTADSQDQRHRMTPGSRPILVGHLGDEPDVIAPELIVRHEPARRLFDETMARTWEALDGLRRLGVDAQTAAYLLPNAVAVRFTESGDFSAIRHKHAMRLCYNAQEEIWRASLDEALQIADVHPRLGRWLLPPCAIRERRGVRPFCPEGPRYCGVPVWKMPAREYVREL